MRKILGLMLFGIVTSAHAHTGISFESGWQAGFLHPLSGWDHLLAMFAVGVWAARQKDVCRWLIPAGFLLLVAIGAVIGRQFTSEGPSELLVLVSLVVIPWLAVSNPRLNGGWQLCILAPFALAHGILHGVEVPHTASFISFGVGFLAATLFLSGCGFAFMRFATLVTSVLLGGTAQSQETNGVAPNEIAPVRLPDVVVQGREDSLVGIAESATEGVVGRNQLASRPILRPGEILETVPGVIITQHAGGGKANQYFLRGFNLDHGTDFLTTLDGMPINLPSHGHGQGYTDLNLLIPELISEVSYQKGPYYSANGDFSSAGAAHFESLKILPQSFVTLEGGMFGYARGVFASSPKVGQGHLLYALEAYHYDGPWRNADDFQKYNGVITYSQGDDALGFSITARGYNGRWDSSDQVAKSAVDMGVVDFFDSLDDTTGGNSHRYSLQAEWHRSNESSSSKLMAYGFHYDLDLFSNFTYFLTDTNRGDQFEQVDNRWTAGVAGKHTIYSEIFGKETENTFGLQFRNDAIRNGLFHTEARLRVDKVDSASGTPLASTVREDDILQSSIGLFYENRMQWGEKFRTVAGVRGDVYRYDVDSNISLNSGEEWAAIGSPKMSLIFGPWAKTEIYVQGGLGFHSNDGRGVNSRVDPVTGLTVDANGDPITPADPLVQTYGAEVGVRTVAIPGLHSTVSFWWLDIDSELVFVGDAGTTEASRPSRRYGIEFANYFSLTKSLTLDADFSLSHAEFRDFDPAGEHIPGSIESVVAAGLTYRSETGFFGGVRLRYFGPRPLIEDNSFRSGETILLSGMIGYRFNKTWTATMEAFNLLDRRDHDITYAYESRINPGATPNTEIHFHPVEPIQVRFAVTARF